MMLCELSDKRLTIEAQILYNDIYTSSHSLLRPLLVLFLQVLDHITIRNLLQVEHSLTSPFNFFRSLNLSDQDLLHFLSIELVSETWDRYTEHFSKHLLVCETFATLLLHRYHTLDDLVYTEIFTELHLVAKIEVFLILNQNMFAKMLTKWLEYLLVTFFFCLKEWKEFLLLVAPKLILVFAAFEDGCR